MDEGRKVRLEELENVIDGIKSEMISTAKKIQWELEDMRESMEDDREALQEVFDSMESAVGFWDAANIRITDLTI